jgi:TldD protein
MERVDALYEALREKADGTHCEAGTHDVVLDPHVAGILAHEAIGHTCEADSVLSGSVAGDWVGRQVASDKITLGDWGGRGPDGRSDFAIHVDDEGTPCRDVTIIENGVLKGFLHSKDTARQLDAEPTGNARAFAFGDEPLVRMRNTAILPGNDRLADMIGAVDRGYYLTRSNNGQADWTSEFMFGITQGYEIKGGKLGRAIRDTTISGVAFDMLKTVTHVGDTLTWMPSAWCGKKQMIQVGMGGPAIKCRITIGGQ